VAAKTLLEKLLLKPGVKLAIVDAPRDQKAPAKAELVARGAAEAVLFYARDAKQLAAGWDKARARLGDGGRLWVAYPKAGQLGTDLNRDELWQLLHERGFEGVRQVAIDDTWSALWFKPLLP
jgi:hypothetical protein